MFHKMVFTASSLIKLIVAESRTLMDNAARQENSMTGHSGVVTPWSYRSLPRRFHSVRRYPAQLVSRMLTSRKSEKESGKTSAMELFPGLPHGMKVKTLRHSVLDISSGIRKDAGAHLKKVFPKS